MISYMIRRLLYMIPTVLIVALIAFLMIHLAPGDPAHFFISEDSPPGEIENVRERLGLNRPAHVQFGSWLANVIRGDFGRSMTRDEPVLDMFIRAFPRTMAVTALAMFMSLIIAIPLGVLSAVHHKKLIDNIASTISVIGYSVPAFWLGMIMVLVFATQLGWFPSQGYVSIQDNFIEFFRHLFMPAIALSFPATALITRMTRSSMLEEIKKDYVKTARSKGLTEKVVLFKHIFRNALNDISTIIGLSVIRLLAGQIVIELVFNFPGVGRLIVTAIERRDYPVIQSGLLWIAAIAVILNLLVDISYAFADPRIRYR